MTRPGRGRSSSGERRASNAVSTSFSEARRSQKNKNTEENRIRSIIGQAQRLNEHASQASMTRRLRLTARGRPPESMATRRQAGIGSLAVVLFGILCCLATLAGPVQAREQIASGEGSASSNGQHHLVSRSVEDMSSFFGNSLEGFGSDLRRRGMNHYFRSIKRKRSDPAFASRSGVAPGHQHYFRSLRGALNTNHYFRSLRRGPNRSNHYFRSLRTASGGAGGSSSMFRGGNHYFRSLRAGGNNHYFRSLRSAGSDAGGAANVATKEKLKRYGINHYFRTLRSPASGRQHYFRSLRSAGDASKRYGASYISRLMGYGLAGGPQAGKALLHYRELGPSDILRCLEQLQERHKKPTDL